MASHTAPRLLSKGDYVSCEGRTCYIDDITNNLGYNVYLIVDMDTGVQLRRSRYQLEYLPVLATGTTNENDDFNTSFASSEPSEQSKRFASVSSLELDQIEMNRCSSNTKKQTSWSVKIFKGELNLLVARHCCFSCRKSL